MRVNSTVIYMQFIQDGFNPFFSGFLVHPWIKNGPTNTTFFVHAFYTNVLTL